MMRTAAPSHAERAASFAVRRSFVAMMMFPVLATAQPNTPPSWTRNAVIYEINTRQYTPEGTFSALRAHLPRLRRLGIDILWVMPVQPIGKEGRKGGLGSPYSISDYRAVNPEYGTTADFVRFVAAAHREGIKVLLDWVPNHTAFDHAWIKDHPDWYTHTKDGKVSYPLNADGTMTDWTDVAELNYDNRDMRKAMIADMKYWLETAKLDGFRCDVAWGVPRDFFAEARSALGKAKPGLFWLAEAEGPELHGNFDMTYGWEFHHLLNELAQNKQPTARIDDYIAKEQRTYPRNAYRMYFTSNHDENSWNGSEFERMGENHLPAYILSATLVESMPLLYSGQEVSLNKRLRFFEKDTIEWGGAPLSDFYHAVFALKHSQQALANGAAGGAQVKLQSTGSDSVYAFSRTKGGNTVLVAVNFGKGRASVPFANFAKGGTYTDWFSKKKVPVGAAGSIDIPAHGYRVLVR